MDRQMNRLTSGNVEANKWLTISKEIIFPRPFVSPERVLMKISWCLVAEDRVAETEIVKKKTQITEMLPD